MTEVQPLKFDITFYYDICNVFSVVLSGVYSKLYPVIIQQLTAADAALLTQFQQLDGLQPSHIGLGPEYDCDMSVVVSQSEIMILI